MTRFLALLLLIASLWLPAAGAAAAELLLFTRKGCAYCALWEREIGGIYPRTAEGGRAPLRRVQTDRPGADDPVVAPPVTVTPTFILLDGTREIGRFSGYTNDLTFWSMLTVLMQKLDAPAQRASLQPAEFSR